MLYTCCTSTKTVLVLLIAAANLQLGVASPIVRRESCTVNLSLAEANLRDGLIVAQIILYNLVSCSNHEYSYIVCCMLIHIN